VAVANVALCLSPVALRAFALAPRPMQRHQGEKNSVASHGLAAWRGLEAECRSQCRSRGSLAAQSPLPRPCNAGTQVKSNWTRSSFFFIFIDGAVVFSAVALAVKSSSILSPTMGVVVDRLVCVTFVLEIVCRLIANGPSVYISDRSNSIDLGLVVLLLFSVFGPILDWPVPVLPGRTAFRLFQSVLRLLKIAKIVKVAGSAPKPLLRIVGVAFFVAVSADLKTRGLQSIVGMMGVFAMLLACHFIFGKDRAEVMFSPLEPGKAFLVKWASLFFVPALVKLPLVQDRFDPAVLACLAVFLVTGFLASFAAAAGVAALFPAKEVEDKPDVIESAPKTSAQRPFKKRLLIIYGAIMALALVCVRQGWRPALCQNVYMLSASIFGFVSGMLAPVSVQKIVHPMFVCLAATWAAAATWGNLAGQLGAGFLPVLAAYSAWPGGGALLSFMLAPAVVALGVLLFEERVLLWVELVPIVVTSFVAAAANIVISLTLAHALALPRSLAAASLLRSITSPIAADLTPLLNASPTFAIAMVVVTGFIGVVLGPPLASALRLRPRVYGLATGASAHGLGTVALAKETPKAFAYSALAFVLVGTGTSLLLQVPILRMTLLRLLP